MRKKMKYNNINNRKLIYLEIENGVISNFSMNYIKKIV